MGQCGIDERWRATVKGRFVKHQVNLPPAASADGDAVGEESAAPSSGRPRGRSDACQAIYARALVLWPGLDRSRLTRTQGDPHKVARLIARRTVLSEESILSLLQA